MVHQFTQWQHIKYIQSSTVHIHDFNHRKPFKSIAGGDDNVLYMWSVLHPYAKSLSRAGDRRGLYFKNNITMNIVEIIVLLTNHIKTNMTSWTYKRCQSQCHIILLDQLIRHYLCYAVKLKIIFCRQWLKQITICFFSCSHCFCVAVVAVSEHSEKWVPGN